MTEQINSLVAIAQAFDVDAIASRRAGRLDAANLCAECAIAVRQGNPFPLSTRFRGFPRSVERDVDVLDVLPTTSGWEGAVDVLFRVWLDDCETVGRATVHRSPINGRWRTVGHYASEWLDGVITRLARLDDDELERVLKRIAVAAEAAAEAAAPQETKSRSKRGRVSHA